MRTPNPVLVRAARGAALTLFTVGLVVGRCTPLNGQAVTTTAFTRAVGGISVAPNGLLEGATVDWIGKLSRLRAESLERIPNELSATIPLRKVSLRRLEAAIDRSARNDEPLPDAIKYLAGLQQIRYVLVYPQPRDLVLVGPAEGWKVGQRGTVVGITTGRPVMLLDDLLVALRTARQAAKGGITCSINPTPEGVVRFNRYIGQFATMGNPRVIEAGAEEAMGPQVITIQGVPATSHFARVLVAADYRMKRLGMGFEKAPVAGLPSYLHMARRIRKTMPRWWLEPDYEALLRSPDGLAWELRGASVKVMTEEDFLTASGGVRPTGKADPVAQRWAEKMTEKYDQLAGALPVFGQLRNCMELAVVAALVVKERLTEKAGYSMPTLLDPAELKVQQFWAPRHVDTQVGMVNKGGNWVISASGGVAVNSWGIADQVQQSNAPADVHTKAAPVEIRNWWWN